MLDSIDLSKFVVTPLTDSEFAQLSAACDRPIPDSIRQLLQTVGAPQNLCYDLPEGEDVFLGYQRGIPAEYCVFARDDRDDNLYAIGPGEQLFRLDEYESKIYRVPESLESWIQDRVNDVQAGDSPIWKVQLSFKTNSESKVLELLTATFRLSNLSDWEFENRSPADVITHHCNCTTVQGPSYVSRQQYYGWQTPIFYFNRDIAEPDIREAKAAFRGFTDAGVGFKLINYGVF